MASPFAIPVPLGSPVSEKLARDNFMLWKAQILPAIRGAQLMGILDGTTPKPPPTIKVEKADKTVEEVANPALATWLAQDQQVLSYVLNSLTKETLAQVATV